MKDISQIKNELLLNKRHLFDKYGLNIMAVFGSYGRGTQNENSDVDILVDFNKPVGLEFIDLARELEGILHLKVDLVSKKGIKPHYLRQIEGELSYV